MIGFVLSLALITPAQAAEQHQPSPSFQKIEQPLPVKLAVTGIGMGLIAAELTWFLKK